MNKTEEDEIEKVLHLCPRCGRSIPPPDLDPLKITEWLLNNDPLCRRFYDLGRYDEKNRLLAEGLDPRVYR